MEETSTPCSGQPFSEEIDRAIIPPHFRQLIMDPFDGTQDPHTQMQAFQTQVYISTLRGVAMQWFSGLPSRIIYTFNDLATCFVSQFATNKVKKLEVAYLFDSKQMKGENLKRYLICFNKAMFSDSLALRRSTSMEEIRARVEKHIDVEEDLADKLEVECKIPPILTKNSQGHSGRANLQHDGNYKIGSDMIQFTPLKVRRSQILREVYHTSLRVVRVPPYPWTHYRGLQDLERSDREANL
ncbi:hypothetical protein CR513_51956, partial [Mucuna pruriens]